MTDLQLIDKYCEECILFISPRLFREVKKRGLYNIIKKLPGDVESRKSVARARLSQTGTYTGDPEIEQIASTVSRIEFLRNELNEIKPTDCHLFLPILKEMTELSEAINSFYK